MITTRGLGCFSRAIIYLFIYFILFFFINLFFWAVCKRSYFPVLGVEVQIKVALSLVKKIKIVFNFVNFRPLFFLNIQPLFQLL